jgi:hypothetical protein
MNPKFPTITEISTLIKVLKKQIGDEYRSTNQDPDDSRPSMDVTLGWTPEDGSWNYQTGDNSFTGGAYGHPHWAVTTIDRRSNSKEVAKDLIDQLADLYYQ